MNHDDLKHAALAEQVAQQGAIRAEQIAQRQALRAEQLALLVDLGLKVLSLRLLTLTVLLLDAGVFSYAMWAGSWVHLAGAALFGGASWCVVHLRLKGASHEA